MKNSVKEIEKLFETLKLNIKDLQKAVDDELFKRPSCCKAGIEQSNFESFRLDDRLRRLEEIAWTKDQVNEKGNRVISVVVPDVDKVTSATVPLGHTGAMDMEEYKGEDQ